MYVSRIHWVIACVYAITQWIYVSRIHWVIACVFFCSRIKIGEDRGKKITKMYSINDKTMMNKRDNEVSK